MSSQAPVLNRVHRPRVGAALVGPTRAWSLGSLGRPCAPCPAPCPRTCAGINVRGTQSVVRFADGANGAPGASVDQPRPEVPAEIPVVCGTAEGAFITSSAHVRCYCATCGGQVTWSPFDWQAHSGLVTNTNYKESIHVRLNDGSLMYLAKFLKGWGLDVKRVKQGDGQKAKLIVVPLDEPRTKKAAKADKDPAAKLARRVQQLQQAVSPVELLPPEFDVMCNGTPGEFVTATWEVRCGCAECGGAKAFSPSSWEKHVGSKHKKWHKSISIVPGRAVPEVRMVPMSMSTFFGLHGFKAGRATVKGHPPALVPLTDDD